MKITIIAPLENIADTAREVLTKQDFNWPGEIEIVAGLLETGVKQAIRAEAGGTDVIISRGATASLIAKHVDIPVVEIQVTAFDILKALKIAGHVSGPVGVVFMRRFLFECEKLGEYIGVPIREIFMENETIEEKTIEIACKQGISTFLGDALSVKLLIERGLNVVPIESSAESISKAIIEAVNLAHVRRRERERAELFRTIIEASADGIIAIDKNEQITIFNQALERMYRISRAEVIGKKIGRIFPDDGLRECLMDDKAERESVRSVENHVFAIKRIPIKLGEDTVGAIANVQDVTQLQNFEQAVRQKLNKKGLVAKFHLEQLSASSPQMKLIKERVRLYAGNDATVLITGESGTGKERVAQSIHNVSQRQRGPFVAINCAALPENLLESELFGYEEGAFTGAKKGGKSGLFELAHGGTIFLDEIGEMPLALQARLLRVLQEKEVMRLGADRVIPVNVRILAATNQDMMRLVDEKKFRVDLYYRLDVLRLHIPPLRERIEDIPELVRSFLGKPLGGHCSGITEEAVKLLQKQYWRGNIRELENVMERVKLLAGGRPIDEIMVRQELAACGQVVNEFAHEAARSAVSERCKIEQILFEEKYNYTQAAKRLGMSRTTLWRKLRQWEKDE
ncbi:sigma 54-interacting transcriptional regulator [Sporomusa acidovorans]|uniref:Anaerobic nitric oxide reductase transcription regulator NorR n=1 Tax=Sporomusa acidovorans (strain ATCC 49682 / DSM 3132 / Mol) TaxID=1123286 RepID=A0ABZ3J9C5_SPOA4|nr:sigma 54-interacting transcriptional regulator [Sporomusa acidovorans]OZC17526.1 propionate catabolism operon regulatory protein [Sporomusa acidovorans DSM 3132]SDF08408.1 PAS domain S-box-containing protein [Sporomusa acidovorans]